MSEELKVKQIACREKTIYVLLNNGKVYARYYNDGVYSWREKNFVQDIKEYMGEMEMRK